jgi:acyl-CoA synthetase (AMP-forming)/AMP-acid ligase II
VAIWAPNVWEWIPTVLGLQAAGGVLVPLNTRYKGAEAGYILRKSRARLLVTVNGFLGFDYVAMLREENSDEAVIGREAAPGVELPVPGLPDLAAVVVVRGEAPAGTIAWDRFLAAGTALDRPALEARVAEREASDLADMLFTSGTTGNPKGVLAAHGQALRCVDDWATNVGLREGDRYLIVNPFFHSFGYKAGIVASLVKGAAMVPLATFDVAAIAELVERERISMLPGPPTIYQSMLNDTALAGRDLSSLRLAVTGAAAIPVEMIRRMRTDLGFETVVTAYGLTEANGFATMCRHDDDAETIATTSGRAMPDVEVRIVDDAGAEVPRGEPGEIVVRGYNVMSGYFEDPEQTAEAIDGHGWLHTGDVGVMDERGYVQITDRKKDMFIVGGFNAYPAEIENLLCDHPAVAQTAVVGVPDERLGEVGAAFVVRRAGRNVTADELLAWAREHMANFKVPRHVLFVDALPLNASGKVLKYQLRDTAAAALPNGSS